MASPTLNGLVHFYNENKDSEQIWDDTHFPIMTLRTIGAPNVELQQKMYALRDPLLAHARDQGLHTVIVSDISMVKTPDAVTRRALSELAVEKDAPFKGCHMATVFIVTNPLMRGIITAVTWLAGDAIVPNIFVPNMAGVITEIRKLYEKVGDEPPHFPADYVFDEPTI